MTEGGFDLTAADRRRRFLDRKAGERVAAIREHQTRWRIRSTKTLGHLNLSLVVDTVAPAVVNTIEQAMRRNGITFLREEPGSE